MAFEGGAYGACCRRAITLTAFMRAKGFANFYLGHPFRDVFNSSSAASAVFETMRINSVRRLMANVFHVNGRFLWDVIYDSRLTGLVMYLTMDFLTRFCQALSGNCLVFVLSDLLINCLRGSVYLSRHRVNRFILSRDYSDNGMFRIIAIGLYTFMIDEEGPNEFANLAMLLHGFDGTNAALGDVMSTINRDLHLFDVFNGCLGLARLSEIQRNDDDRFLREIRNVIECIVVEPRRAARHGEIRANYRVDERELDDMRRIYVEDFKANEASRNDVIEEVNDGLFNMFFRFLLRDDSIFYAYDGLRVGRLSVTDFRVLLRLFFLLIMYDLRVEVLSGSNEIGSEEVKGYDGRRI